MRKFKYYFDSSVFGFIFEEEDLAKRDTTLRLFNNWSKIAGEMFISEIVLREIEEHPNQSKASLLP